jgi:hypothetical protein
LSQWQTVPVNRSPAFSPPQPVPEVCPFTP